MVQANGSANPVFHSGEHLWCLDTWKNRQHVKYTKNSTHMAVCCLLSSNGMFSNLHGSLPMKLFKSFQVIASHFSTPIFTDWPDSLSRLQLLQTVQKFYQQDVWDCSSLVSVAKCSRLAPWVNGLPRSSEFARPSCSASYQFRDSPDSTAFIPKITRWLKGRTNRTNAFLM